MTNIEIKAALLQNLPVTAVLMTPLPHSADRLCGTVSAVIYRKGADGKIQISAQISDSHAVHVVDIRRIALADKEEK